MVDGFISKTGNRCIIGQRRYVMGVNPAVVQASVTILSCCRISIKSNRIFILGPHDAPRIAILQPQVWFFYLPTVFNILVENAVVVANAVANGGYAEG